MSVDVARSDWSVLTKTENGTVSLIRNMPLAQAVKIYDSLDPWRGRVSGKMYSVNGSDIRQREIIGPEGWDGCTKFAHHDYPEPEWKIVDGGPNKGRYSAGVSCVHCGHYDHRWQDGLGYLGN